VRRYFQLDDPIKQSAKANILRLKFLPYRFVCSAAVNDRGPKAAVDSE